MIPPTSDDLVLAYRVSQLEAKLDLFISRVESRMDAQDQAMKRLLFAIIGGTFMVAIALFSVALTVLIGGSP